MLQRAKFAKFFLSGQKVPKGWLFDKKWKNVTDPREFYILLSIIFIMKYIDITETL